MKRSFLYTALVLTTVFIATGSRTFGDSKTRIGANGFGQRQSSNHSSSTSGSASRRPGNLNVLQNGTSEKVGFGKGNPGGFNPRNHGIHLPPQGNNSHQQQEKHSTPIVKFPGHHGRVTSPESNVAHHVRQPKGIGHAIHLPNGATMKPVGINVNHILKHKVPAAHQQTQIQHIVASAPKHLCVQPHFSWWVNICHSHCHTHYGCWNTNEHYWDCWEPCNWQVVQCEQFSYYVGLSCVHIPDMQAYGVQSVINGSPAQLAGLLPGDVIVTVNGQPALDPNLVNSEVVRGRLELLVIREGAPAPLQMVVLPRLVQSVSF